MRTTTTQFTVRLALCMALFVALFIALGDSARAVTPEVYDLTVDGVKVIVQPTKANQIIAVDLGIQGGYARGETDNPEVPAMSAALSTVSGTASLTKDQYREALSRLVASIGGNADPYASTYSLSCARPVFDQAWKLFADVIRSPRFDSDEFSRLRIQEMTNIMGRRTEPESWANFLIDSIWAAGHRAGRISEPADVQSLTIDQLRAYHTAQLERSRMLIVIVGDVTRDEVQNKVHELLASIPQGKFAQQPYEQIQGPHTSTVIAEERTIPTTYIVGRFAGPARMSPEFWPTRVGSIILSDRLYEEVRTKRNLSYAPYSYYGGGEGEYFGQIGVSTTNPDSAMHVIVHELNRVRDSGVTAKELRDTKESTITQIYMSQQSNLAEANRLYLSQLETGDYHNALNTVDQLTSVTTDQIKQAFDAYLHDIYWVAIGNKSQILPSDFIYR